MGEGRHKLEWYAMDCAEDLPIYVEDARVRDCIDSMFANMALLERYLEGKDDERSRFLRDYYLDGGWHKGLRWQGPPDPETFPLDEEEARRLFKESLSDFGYELEVDGVRAAGTACVMDARTAIFRAAESVDWSDETREVVLRIRRAPSGPAAE